MSLPQLGFFRLATAYAMLVFCTLLIRCGAPENQSPLIMVTDTPITLNRALDIQGHRGCRGIMPENTIPGFLKALDIGVQTLELDVVITSDHKVLCSHEPWFCHTIAHDPQGHLIQEKDEQKHAIYKMTYAQSRAYDCGMRPHPDFPEQLKMPVSKPLLSAVIEASDSHALETGRPLPYYNIETKCTLDGDNIFHPSPEVFSDLLVAQIIHHNITDRAIVQSFDVRTLRRINITYPEIKLALLIESEGMPELNIEKLGFYPEIYSPHYLLVDQELVEFCRRHKMKLIPWTVNEVWEMEKLISLGVDGIISDYPDRISERNINRE